MTIPLDQPARSTARANANIALIKYWGKSDTRLNTPAVGSVSITLEALWTETEVTFDSSLAADSLLLNGIADAAGLERVSRCLDVLRLEAGASARASVVSRNSFPTGAGLASSASGFAALVCAAADALGLDPPPEDLSRFARRGSGSAARSLFGGFVAMHAGRAPDGRDSFAEPLLSAEDWPLTVVIALTARKPKEVGSSSGMQRSAASSPYYSSWIDRSEADVAGAKEAISSRDFARLGTLAEHSCLKMHALAMTSRPPLVYWNAATLVCIEAIRDLQRHGVPVFFTIDAGPQLKAVCLPEATSRVTEVLSDLPGVLEIIVSGLGPGARPVESAWRSSGTPGPGR
jgi:diphosphomevalonate decarboxylase